MESETNTGIINNKKIYAFKSRKEFLDHIEFQRKILIALNAEKLDRKDNVLEAIINENIGYPDGIGAVWALKRKGVNSIKIAGAEFWLDIISKYHESKTFYLIGSAPEVIEQTVTKLKVEFPDIDIKGFRDGYFKYADVGKIIKDFKEKKPDVVFVAMGSPKQELLMSNLIKEYPALYMGLGGSFDVYVGLKKRAPIFFQKLGLEWFYRLMKEPTRISRQVSLFKFLIKIIFGKI